MSQQLAHSSEDLVHTRFTKRLRVLACICLIVVSVPLLFSFLHVLNVYVILGESMVPTLNPGDLFLTGPQTEEIQEGTVIVFRSPFNDLVVHRVIDRVAMSDGLYYVTKGDANDQTDSYLVAEDEVLGFPSLVIPKLGFYFLIPRELALMSMMGLILAYTSLSYMISQPGDDALTQPHWLISTLTRTKHRVLTALPFTIEYETEMDVVEPTLDSLPASTLQIPERLALPEHPPPTPPTAMPPERAVSPPIVRVTTKPRVVRMKRRPVEAQVEDELDAITTVAKSQVLPTLDAEAERDGHSVPAVTITRSAHVQRTRPIVRVKRRSMDRRFSKRDKATSSTQSATDDDAIRHIVRVKRRPVVHRKRRSVEAQVTDELAQIKAAAASQTSLDDAEADRAKPSVRVARFTRSSHIARIHSSSSTPQRQLEKEASAEPTTRSEPSSSDESASISDIASLRERVEKEKTVLSEEDVQRILKILEQASARRPRDWIVRRSQRTRKRRRPNPY